MKSFLRTFIASFLGVFTAICFIGFGTVGLIVSLSQFSISPLVEEEEAVDEGVLHLRLGAVVENLKEDPVETLLSSGLDQGPRPFELRKLLKILKDVSKDTSVKGVLLEIGQGQFSWAIANEIRLALFNIKNKPVVVYSKSLTEKTLFVSSAANKVYMMPYGDVEWNGFSSTSAYLKTTLEKWNVKAQVVRAGKFKSAAEMFVEEQMSEANREQVSVLLNDLWSYICEQVAQGRKLNARYLNELADTMSVIHPQDALKAKLIDGLLYIDQVKKIKIKGVNFSQKISLRQYLKREDKALKKIESEMADNHIAVIYATGTIVGSNGGSDQISGEEFMGLVNKVRKSKKAKALVIRVNSPGGSALASEEMHRSLAALKEENKNFPIVVSFGGVAASGGYYLSAGADQIFSDPLTVTGSIGVFALLFNTSDFMTNDLHVKFQNVKTNKHGNFLDGTQPMSDFERQVLQKSVDKIYDRFIYVVAEGRKKTANQINKVAQGRVWTGLEAQKVGLVDQLGGMEKAIEYAAQKADLGDDYYVYVVDDSLSKWKRLAMSLGVKLKWLWSFGEISSLNDFLIFFNKEQKKQLYMLETRFSNL